MSRVEIKTSCTRDCPNTCGLVATVADGRLVKLAGDPCHPLTKGVACHKTAKYIHRVYSPERIVHPMLKEGGRWRQASWDEVFDLIADRLKITVAESGPEAILYYQGNGERTALKLLNKYFFNLMGGVTTMRGSLCGGAGQGAQELDLGKRISHDPLDHGNSRSIILWARNPVSTNISLVPLVRTIKKRGGTVIVIDPVRSRSAALGDRHIAPTPGGDGYLAMAAAKLILAAGAEDREFLFTYSVGFEAYQAILNRFSVEELCSLAGVSVMDATFLADTLVREKPTATLLGWGVHRYEHAHYSIRPIDALGALSGNIGVAGGGVSQGFEEYAPYDQTYWGDELNPPRRTFLHPKLGEEILGATNPPIRMIYVTSGNPVCMAPHSCKVRQAFGRAEFMVYSGHFMDDTASLADVFLPATTFLEENDIAAGYGHNFVGAVNQVIPPVGECLSEFHMFHALAERFPFAGRFQRPVDAWLQDICAPLWAQGTSLEAVREGAFRMDAPMVPYADKTFPTESGKFQFMTEFDPMEQIVSDRRYPYKLLTIAPHSFICSERTMAEHSALPSVTMHAQEAERNGVQDGMVVSVSSSVGEVRARLKVDASMRRDVVIAERGGWAKAGHGLNQLTRDIPSLVGQGTPFYDTSVAIGPVYEKSARILVVRERDLSPEGTFCKELERQGAMLVTLRPDGGDPLPETLSDFDGLVVFGGPEQIQNGCSKGYLDPLMRLMRECDAAGKPVAGIRHGCHLLALAHGGSVKALDEPEFGFSQPRRTELGRVDSVVGGTGPVPELMGYHCDSFDLPSGASLLMEGASGDKQCFKVGQCSYGFEFHPGADSSIVMHWIELFRQDESIREGRFRMRYDDAFFEALMTRLPLLLADSEAFCRHMVQKWLESVVSV